MTIYAVANQKGGSAKSTTAWMLARQWAASGRTVLLIDLDPQAHLTTACNLPGATPTISDVLTRIMAPKESSATLTAAARPIGADGRIRCVPSSLDLENVALNLQQSFLHTITALHSALSADGAHLGVDHVLIDCPPSAGVLTLNALIAADAVIIPSSPEPWDIDGVRKMIGVVEQVQERRGGLPRIAGIVATKTDDRTVQHQQGLQALHSMPVPVIGQIDRRNGVDAESQIQAGYASVARLLLEATP
jgi:chromosome partitioning protein